MSNPPEPYTAVSTFDKEQWTSQQNGKTFQSYVLTAKNQAGETVEVEINRAISSPAPSSGETLWLETWETEYGLKGRKKQGPRQQANFIRSMDGGDSRESAIVRQHSQHMALLYATAVGEKDLTKIEAWTDHFDADVQRASGTGQGGRSDPGSPHSSSAPSQASNGDAKITEKQIGLVLMRQKMHSIPDDDMARLVQLFHIERLKDLPRGSVDEFLTAMVNPIPNDSSDVPVEPEPTPVASESDDELPF